MWQPQVEALEAAGHRALAPTCPASATRRWSPGRSRTSTTPHRFLDGPATVVGCSFGGGSRSSSRGRPELVERLVLIGAGSRLLGLVGVGAGGFAEEEEAIERGDLAAAAASRRGCGSLTTRLPDVRELTEAMVLRSYEQHSPSKGEVRAVWPEPSAETRLGELDVPTLLVVGDADRPELLSLAERLARELPDARLETIDGAGHLPSLERPDELNRLLLNFLQ
jgi:pimeloyl-ACP methyl ester carboxylesterase